MWSSSGNHLLSEVQSGIARNQASIVETDPEVALGPDGKPLLAKEIVVLIGLPKAATHKDSNVTIRGISEQSLALRPQVRLVKGRMPKAGSTEIATGLSIVKRFEGADMGDTLRFGTRDWRVVGVFDAGNTGFSSEIWADTDQLMQAFRRQVYSSVLFRLRDTTRFDALKSRIETDPRLTLEAKRETRYYLDQSEMMAKFLNVLGISVTIIFSLGAIIGAMITMYSSVANRTAEIGTMRALGFQKMNILGSFLAGSSPARPFRRHHRTVRRLFPPVLHRLNAQFPNLLRTCLQLHHDRRHRHKSNGLRAHHGFCRRRAAGISGGTNEYCRSPPHQIIVYDLS